MEWLAALNAAFARDPAIDEIGFIVDDLEHGEAARHGGAGIVGAGSPAMQGRRLGPAGPSVV